jgi:hypothetical protein
MVGNPHRIHQDKIGIEMKYNVICQLPSALRFREGYTLMDEGQAAILTKILIV